METKFSLYFSHIKNAFVGLFFLMSYGDVSAQHSAVVSNNTVAVADPVKKAEGHAVVNSPKVVDGKVSATTSSVVAGDSVKKVEDKKAVSEGAVVPTSTNAVVDPVKKAEGHAPVTTSTSAVVNSPKVVDGNVSGTTSSVAAGDSVKKVEDKKAVSEGAVVSTSTNAVVDPANKAVTQTTQVVADVEKDAPVSGFSEALKAELLAELTKVVQKQVKEEVSAKMANPNVTASETANISSNVKPSVIVDKDEKTTVVQKPAEASASVKVQKTPCNMLTAATCGENPACALHNKFCRTNCVIIPDEGACIAASDCEWGGAFKRSCEFKK